MGVFAVKACVSSRLRRGRLNAVVLLLLPCCGFFAGCADDGIRGTELSALTSDSPSVLSENLSATDAGPIVCHEPVWNFGTIDPRETPRLTHTFRLQNVSEKPVDIAEVKPTCGCIVPEPSHSIIEPGCTVDFSVTFNTAGRPGRFGKSVTVRFRSAEQAFITLHIEGEITVTPDVYAVPTVVDFGILGEQETKRRTVTLARFDGSPIQFQRVECESEAIQLLLAEPGDVNDSFAVLTITLDSSLLNAAGWHALTPLGG